MKILITGNLGYVGSKFTEFIRKNDKNIEIYGCDVNLYRNSYVKKSIYKIRKQYAIDFRELTDKNLLGIDAIVHLAALSNDPIGKLIADDTYKVNYEGTKKLVNLAKKSGVKKFIFASSCSVYGFAGSAIKNESDSLKPQTVYAKSKILSEKFLKKITGIQVYILRFGTACGYSNKLRLDLVLNEFVFTALKFKKINILSDGLPYRPMIHVYDMSKAIYACLKDVKKNFYSIFNVGISNFQVIEMANKVAKFCNCKINVNDNVAIDKRSYKVSFDKFNKFAGIYKPSLNIENIIIDLLKNYKKNRISDTKNYLNSKFIRLAVIRKLLKRKKFLF